MFGRTGFDLIDEQPVENETKIFEHSRENSAENVVFFLEFWLVAVVIA